MNQGWIKLWRKSMQSQVWANKDLWQLWCYCLMKANHADNWASIQTGRGETQVLVKTGQFLFGRNTAAKILRQKSTSVYNRLVKLQKLGNIVIQADTHFSIITICNWDTYQSVLLSDGQATGQATDRQLTGNGQPMDTNKNVKKDKNVKNVKKQHIFTPPTLEELEGYIKEKAYKMDAEVFRSFYESKGWMVGKNKMQSWKAALAQANCKGWAVKAPARRTAMDVVADMEKKGEGEQ